MSPGSSTCGVRTADDHVMCWGGLVAGHGEADTARRPKHISLNTQTSCFVDDEGHAGCWAERFISNQTIVGTEAAPPADVVFDTIDMGEQFGCGLRAGNHMVACWGGGSFVVDNAPTSGAFVELAVAHSMACAVDAGRALTCWGPTANTRPMGVALHGLTGGTNGICGLRDDDTAACWGSSDGINNAPTTLFSDLAVGYDLACGVRQADGLLECWGDSETYASFAPTDVAFKQVGIAADEGGDGGLAVLGKFVAMRR